MKCPECNNEMEKDEDVMYPYYCVNCHGYWSEEGILDYIGNKSNKPLDTDTKSNGD